MLQLGQMLMLEPQPVKLEGRGAMRLIGLDHAAPAAGIAADGVDRDRIIGRDDAGFDQRLDQGDAAGRIAAGIGDAPGAANGGLLPFRHLGEPIDPAGCHAVGGAGIDDLRTLGAHRVDHRHGLARRVVRQAEHHQVGRFQHLALGDRVLAALGRDRAQRDTGQPRQALADAEAGGAGFAVDEDRPGPGDVAHVVRLLPPKRAYPIWKRSPKSKRGAPTGSAPLFDGMPQSGPTAGVAISASRTGSCVGPSPCRTSCARPRGCRG